ncbi:ribosome biogenesis regulatory protein, partial [Haematococcus lacustris]
QKPLPKPKPLTKWQKFAQKKGIVKKKRSKLEFDESKQEWRRRHGYKKAGDEADIPIVEARPGDKVGEDPFSRMEADKKERVKRNRSSQLDNARAAQAAGALPPTLRLAASLAPSAPAANSKAAGPKRLQKAKRKELRAEIKAASRLSGISTASMGKFDKTLRGEKEGERVPLGKRRKFL